MVTKSDSKIRVYDKEVKQFIPDDVVAITPDYKVLIAYDRTESIFLSPNLGPEFMGYKENPEITEYRIDILFNNKWVTVFSTN